MEINLVGSTNSIFSLEEMVYFSQKPARRCYSGKDWKELLEEPKNERLIQQSLKSGHHSVFEHMNLTFNISGIPKILAMFLNNEKQYATSEKSARYTQMKDIEPGQKEKYDDWMGLLTAEIDKVFPKIKKDRDKAIKKLAQENARYMTSVFTNTEMVHTVNLRQLNFIVYEFEDFIQKYEKSDETIKHKLIPSMKDFLSETEWLKIKGLKNQTDRELSFFNPDQVEEHFGDVYSTSYLLSFAGLAQTQRHRTIDYSICKGTELGAPLGFLIPAIIRENTKLSKKWANDLEKIAEYDFPQAQLLKINEMGIKRNFRSKMRLRLCGHAQYEIMENTLAVANKYAKYNKDIGKMLSTGKPQCTPNRCKGCNWGNRYGIKRVV